MKTSFVAFLSVCALAAADQVRHLRSSVEINAAPFHIPSIDVVVPKAGLISDELNVDSEALDDLSSDLHDDLTEENVSQDALFDSDSAELVDGEAHEILVALADTQALLTKVHAALDGKVRAKGWRDELAKLKNKTVDSEADLEEGSDIDSEDSDSESTDIESEDTGFDWDALDTRDEDDRATSEDLKIVRKEALIATAETDDSDLDDPLEDIVDDSPLNYLGPSHDSDSAEWSTDDSEN
uniref:Secreted protein n=1 Tax=Achlya hypogyna TaxID=1202772 RepID=A0A0A7CN23_ACHHY|nr:secreted protein [Achlya hypogyna]